MPGGIANIVHDTMEIVPDIVFDGYGFFKRFRSALDPVIEA
jgi:hypothetical protein